MRIINLKIIYILRVFHLLDASDSYRREMSVRLESRVAEALSYVRILCKPCPNPLVQRFGKPVGQLANIGKVIELDMKNLCAALNHPACNLRIPLCATIEVRHQTQALQQQDNLIKERWASCCVANPDPTSRRIDTD